MPRNNIERLEYLIRKYVEGEMTEKEDQELSFYLKEHQTRHGIKRILEVIAHETRPLENYNRDELDRMVNKIISGHIGELKHRVIKKHLFIKKALVAATMVVCVLTGAYFLKQKKGENNIIVQKGQDRYIENDIAPGSNKAVLTLSDGSSIVLDRTAREKLINYEILESLKIEQGKLSYLKGKNKSNPATQYNTVSTPRGGEYQVVLPDGSKVWLNAASSLKFPIVFSDKDRVVELSGEAYFDIAHQKKHPFKVKVKDVEVEVLGTIFNINSYEDEETIRTTLLKGSVRQTQFDKAYEIILTPRQQAQVSKNMEVKVVDNVDITQVIAWQSGMFEFNNTDIAVIMRQISRWYDINVIYETELGSVKFGGGISKKLPLSKVLELLQANGMRFKLEGRNLKVFS